MNSSRDQWQERFHGFLTKFLNQIDKNFRFSKKFLVGKIRCKYTEILRADPKLYIPSTLNIDLILWHTQLIVFALKY